MRRHAESDPVKAEPNLVPLLDLVFQLIMFFMICVNFVSEQVTTEVRLPQAQSARPMDKTEVEVMFLNLDKNGKLIVSGVPEPFTTPGQMRFYLKQQFEDTKRAAEYRGDKSGKVNTAIILRADTDSNYGQIYQLLQLCKDVGYRKLQLRAYYKPGG